MAQRRDDKSSRKEEQNRTGKNQSRKTSKFALPTKTGGRQKLAYGERKMPTKQGPKEKKRKNTQKGKKTELRGDHSQ